MKIKFKVIGLTNSSREFTSSYFKGGSTTKVSIDNNEKYARVLIKKVEE